MANQSKKRGLFEKLIDFLAKILSIKQVKKEKKKSQTDDIYPMW